MAQTKTEQTADGSTAEAAWGLDRAPEDIVVHPRPVTPNALKVLEKRYLAKDDKGKVIESPEGMWVRVARNLAKAEARYVQPQEDAGANAVVTVRRREAVVARVFESLMAEQRFLPNSPTLMNAGRELQQLSACFVLPVPDDIPAIFEAIKQQAIIHKTGGGTGFSFSRIRPKNDIVGSTGGIASGPVSFMKIFNTATEQIKQGGTRRGANMAVLRVDHPDILEFIDMKMDLSQMTNFNVSVALTDAFMDAWKRGGRAPLVNPKTGEHMGDIDAREVMDRIAHNAWLSGEPGLFFIDRANATNPVPHVAPIEATNPCGEQDLMPYDSCNLGSIVLDNHLREVRARVQLGPAHGEHRDNVRYEVDWDALRLTVWQSVRLLDNVIDMNNYPLPQIEEMSKGTRRIGLGIMGFARMLFKLQVPYDSDEGLDMARQVMKFIRDEGVRASEALALERGPYGFWQGSVHQKAGLTPRRNSYVTTIAPTGTISMITDTSGGCEPEFSLIWYKNVMDGTHLPYVLDYFREVAQREGFWYPGLMDEVLSNKGSCRGLAGVPEHWQRVFATAMDVSPEWHVKMQAAFQQHVDAAVSKTVNLPKNATEADVKKAYLLAYETGCKGITVYRDGSRQDQVLNLGKSEKLEAASGLQNNGHKGHATSRDEAPHVGTNGRNGGHTHNGGSPGLVALVEGERPGPAMTVSLQAYQRLVDDNARLRQAEEERAKAPARGVRVRAADEVDGVRVRITTGYGDLYASVNFEDGTDRPVEILATLGRAGGYTQSMVEGMCRQASVSFQLGGTVEDVVRQWQGIRSPKVAYDKRDKVLSVPDGLAHALRRAIARRQRTLARLHGRPTAAAEPDQARAAPGEEPPARVVADTDPGEMDIGTLVPRDQVDEVAEEEAAGLLVARGDTPECPECGRSLALQEGCIKCLGCGYSEC